MTIMMRARGKKGAMDRLGSYHVCPSRSFSMPRKAIPQPARNWISELSPRIPIPEPNRAGASVPAA